MISIDAATCEYSYTSLQKILIHWIIGCSPRPCWKVRKDTVHALSSFVKIGKIFNSKNPKASGFQKRICRSLVASSQGGWRSKCGAGWKVALCRAHGKYSVMQP